MMGGGTWTGEGPVTVDVAANQPASFSIDLN